MARSRRFAPRGEPDVIEAMAEVVAAALREAVAGTLEQRSPEPAREQAGHILELDEMIPPGEPPPGEIFTLMLLGGWITGATDADGGPVDPEEILAWIEENVGRRYRARSKYVIGMLYPEQAHETMTAYSEALGDDFLPCLLWITAALTALYHDGDASWLQPR